MTSVQFNFFGAFASLESLRPLLARSPAAPRAVAVSPIGALFAAQPDLVDDRLGGDEPLRSPSPAKWRARPDRPAPTSTGCARQSIAAPSWQSSGGAAVPPGPRTGPEPGSC